MLTKANARLVAALVGVLALLGAAEPASAQFGKNKVQYETFDFRVLRTEHFDVHYYPEFEAAALDAARMAERAYARLSKVFRHEWEERKPLVLYASQSDFQQTNIFRFQLSEGIQGITEGIRDRIVLFFPSAYPEFDHTLTHELVHAFQYDIMRRGTLAQGSNPFSFRPPLWFMEGMAEYLSTGRIDSQTAMWLRDASLAGYLTDLDELARVGDIRVYRFGQAIFYYIGTKYGDQKIGEIMQKAPLIGVEDAIEAALHRDLEELSEEWLEAVRLTYLPQVLAFPTAADAATRLTNHVEEGAAINVAPALSPDGSKVAFLSDRDWFNDVWMADAEDGENADKLVKGERTASFESMRFLRAGLSFSPDGRFLAFSSKAGEQDALYVMRVEDEEIVASHRFGLEGIETPAWSPTGEELVFTGLSGGVSDLYVVGRDGSGFRRLTDDRYSQRDPVWSPDGARIAFTTDFGPGTDFDLLAYGEYQIGIYDLTTGEISFLPDQAGKNINPQWGPDGASLAFISDRSGIPNVFLHDFERGETYQITDLLTGVSGILGSSPALSWSRDGSRMVFSAFSDGGWDLYRIDRPRLRARRPWRPAERGEYDLAARAFVRPVGGEVAGAEAGPDEEASDQAPDPPGGEEGEIAGASDRRPQAIQAYLGDGDRDRETPRTRPRVPSFRHPVDVATLLSDPTIGLPRDTTAFESRDYDVDFQPDMMGRPQVGFVSGIGAFGASQLAFSDLLGDHNLFVSASVFGSITDSDLFFTYANLKRRLNWGVTAYQFRSDFAPLSVSRVENLLFRSDIYRGVQGFGAYPFSRFRRIELGGVVAHVDRQVARFDLFDPSPEIVEDLENEMFVSPSLAYVYDTAFYGTTGPIGGSRQRIELQRAFGDRDFTQVYGDLRKYWFFGKRFTLATRLLYLGTFGQSQENLRFQSIGGPTLLRGFDFRDVNLVGSTVGLWNLEFRFPLVERPRLGSSLLPPIRGAVWYDLGFASCGNERCPHQLDSDTARESFRFSTGEDPGPLGFRLVDARAAFGAGVRTNLFGFAVLRLDYARQTDMAEVGDGRWVFTIAPEF
ncbi:MAG: DPP IV N-terminal domain-containing protein [Gemmatimonadota bacterium]|nr:DPP IV N-terminal domain-containing protein [Gemmatimonadota bacterium]